eukprot:gene8875-11972_t
MGNASYRQTTGNQYLTPDLRIFFQHDLPKFMIQSKIGNGKFMKTYVMRVDSTSVVVKVYMKLSDEDLQVPSARLTHIWKVLSPVKYPNLLPYQMWIKSSSSRIKSAATPVYLIRQYFNANLYDRLLTRPFLNELEKLWLLFQVFKCIEIAHENDIIHGDIKPENIMCTTSNWITLTDFSPFKPTMIPDDDPTDFQYYFDSMGRHRCYVAPERFSHKDVKSRKIRPTSTLTTQDEDEYITGENRDLGGKFSSQLTPAMDVFSLGCVMAEIFLDGVPLLDLPGMLQYLSDSSSNPMQKLDHEDCQAKALLTRIKNKLVRDTIIDMTQRDPNKRLSIPEYLDVLQGKSHLYQFNDASGSTNKQNKKGKPPLNVNQDLNSTIPFPPYFNEFLYPLFFKLHWQGITPDDRINIICENYEEMMIQITGQLDKKGNDFFPLALQGVYLSAIFEPAFEYGYEDNNPMNSLSNKARVDNIKRVSLRMARERKVVSGGKSDSSTDIFVRALQGNYTDGNEKLLYGDDNTKNNSSHTNDLNLPRPPIINSKVDVQSASPTSIDYYALTTDDLLNQAQQLIRNTHLKLGTNPSFSLPGSSVDKNDSTPPPLVTDSNQKPIFLSAPDLANHMLNNVKHSDEDIFNSMGSTSSIPNLQSPQRFFDVDVTSDELRNNFQRPKFEGLIVIINILSSSFRHLKFPQSKQVTLMLLVRIGLRCSDDVILQRIIPTILIGVEDQSSPVRAMAIRALRSLLLVVEQFNPLESNIFPLYIFPSLSRIAKDPEIAVRVAFAESIGRVAETAKKFLDKTHFLAMSRIVNETVGSGNGDNSSTNPNSQTSATISANVGPVQSDFPLIDFPYDMKLELIKDQISRWIRDLIIDSSSAGNGTGASPSGNNNNSMAYSNESFRKGSGLASYGSIVKRVLLADIIRLCTFFGQESTMDKLLTQLLTLLNDQDWELRYAFCAKIPYVSAFLGSTVTTECILPCIENAVYDVEERVVVCAVNCLAQLIEMKLMPTLLIVEFADKCKPLLIHPSYAVRTITSKLLISCTNALGKVDAAVFIFPILHDIFRYDLSGSDLSLDLIRNALIPHWSRSNYRKALISRIHKLTNQQLASSTGVSISNPIPSNLTLTINQNPDQRSLTDEPSESSEHPCMSGYLDLAAKEINSKSLQWRNGINSNNGGFSGSPATASSFESMASLALKTGSIYSSAVRDVVAKSDMDSLMDVSNNIMPEHSLQSLLVPHQKYGIFYFQLPTGNNSEDTAVTINNSNRRISEGFKSVSKIRSLYGITVSQADAARALAAGAGDQWDSQPVATMNSGVNPLPSTNQVSNGSVGLVANNSSANTNNLNNSSTPTRIISNSSLPNLNAPNNRGKSFAAPVTNNNSMSGVGSGADNSNNRLRKINPALAESVVLTKRINALNIPPLPVDLGVLVQPDGRKYSCYNEYLDVSASFDSQNRSIWRPKENVLLATLREHSGSVNRIAVAPDQTYFTSASSDKTVKIWQTRNLERVAFPRSVATYSNHRGAIIDMTPLENSHSMATASDDGSLHIWRVDLMSGSNNVTNNGANGTLGGYFDSNAGNINIGSNNITPGFNDGVGYQENTTVSSTINRNPITYGQLSAGVTVSGASVIKCIDPREGPLLSVQHYNSDICSVVTYATQRGGIHGWDLRASKEAFNYTIRPELGYPTSMALAPDRNWMCVGTSKGYVALWDIRYNSMSKLLRHSSNQSVHRLALGKSLPKSSNPNSLSGNISMTDGAYLFLTAGYNNEAAVWGIPEAGECFKCFRTVPLDSSRMPVAPLPELIDIKLPSHPNAPILDAVYAAKQLNSNSFTEDGTQHSLPEHSVRISQSNLSYLITAGTDKSIRYWDFMSPMKCFTVSGLDGAQPKGLFDAPKLNDNSTNKLFVCYITATPSPDKMLQAHLPIREGRGICGANPNFKDAITDLKHIDIPLKLLISSSRDGEIKLWR